MASREIFVDITFCSAVIASKVKLREVSAQQAYLETPAPMPVGTPLILQTGGANSSILQARVARVVEQTAAALWPPGMWIAWAEPPPAEFLGEGVAGSAALPSHHELEAWSRGREFAAPDPLSGETSNRMDTAVPELLGEDSLEIVSDPSEISGPTESGPTESGPTESGPTESGPVDGGKRGSKSKKATPPKRRKKKSS